MKTLKWIKDRLSHKLEHLRWSSIKKVLKQHGLALVVIIVGWEIIEDVIFPLIFAALGNYVHPVFYTGIPAAWLLCFHWIAVPLLWGWWMKYSGAENKEIISTCNHDHANEQNIEEEKHDKV